MCHESGARMKYAWWLFNGIALLSAVLLLAIACLYLREVGGAYTIGDSRGVTLISSGGGRLIIVSTAFRTGSFSPRYSNLALLASLLPAACGAAWAIRHQKGRRR